MISADSPATTSSAMPSPGYQDSLDALAPGKTVVVRDETWLVTNVESSADGWMVTVRDDSNHYLRKINNRKIVELKNTNPTEDSVAKTQLGIGKLSKHKSEDRNTLLVEGDKTIVEERSTTLLATSQYARGYVYNDSKTQLPWNEVQ